jgi:hypothetical protein
VRPPFESWNQNPAVGAEAERRGMAPFFREGGEVATGTTAPRKFNACSSIRLNLGTGGGLVGEASSRIIPRVSSVWRALPRLFDSDQIDQSLISTRVQFIKCAAQGRACQFLSSESAFGLQKELKRMSDPLTSAA